MELESFDYLAALCSKDKWVHLELMLAAAAAAQGAQENENLAKLEPPSNNLFCVVFYLLKQFSTGNHPLQWYACFFRAVLAKHESDLLPSNLFILDSLEGRLFYYQFLRFPPLLELLQEATRDEFNEFALDRGYHFLEEMMSHIAEDPNATCTACRTKPVALSSPARPLVLSYASVVQRQKVFLYATTESSSPVHILPDHDAPWFYRLDVTELGVLLSFPRADWQIFIDAANQSIEKTLPLLARLAQYYVPRDSLHLGSALVAKTHSQSLELCLFASHPASLLRLMDDPLVQQLLIAYFSSKLYQANNRMIVPLRGTMLIWTEANRHAPLLAAGSCLPSTSAVMCMSVFYIQSAPSSMSRFHDIAATVYNGVCMVRTHVFGIHAKFYFGFSSESGHRNHPFEPFQIKLKWNAAMLPLLSGDKEFLALFLPVVDPSNNQTHFRAKQNCFVFLSWNSEFHDNALPYVSQMLERLRIDCSFVLNKQYVVM